MDQVNLQIGDNVLKAMDYAFDEAQERLVSLGESFDPFTVTVVDEGLEVNDHPAETPSAVRDSVKILLAQDMPEGYALCYDGFVETDEGTLDAIVVEVATRGAASADTLALIYTSEDGTYTFETDYAYVGPAAQLYPAGTKPIVSGLASLELEQDDADFDEEPADEEPADEGAEDAADAEEDASEKAE